MATGITMSLTTTINGFTNEVAAEEDLRNAITTKYGSWRPSPYTTFDMNHVFTQSLPPV